ncbi:MAG TPA: GGDEF domain-containing protein [Vicinamibacteria bacterium]|nr:GGDEF domain-containing protein [Vicinamibacteria bacterium]
MKFAKTLAELKRIGREDEVSRDALLWRQGDSGDEVVVLLEGHFDVLRESPEGEPVVVRTVDAGALLGEMSALGGLGRSAAVRAGTTCRIPRVPGEEFRALIRSRPDLLEELFWQQVAWVRSLTEEVARTHKPSILDRLTRLYTERFFRDRLRAELERARETGDVLSIVMLEIDDYSLYREAEGARTGDEGVAKIAQILHDVARKGELIARFGDVRFAVLLYGATQGDARRLAERIRERMHATPFKGASALPAGRLNVSLGTATCPMEGARVDSLLDTAELALQGDRLAGERASGR